MQKHVTVVGVIHIAYNAFGILAAMATFLFVVGGGLVGGLVSGEEEIVIPITFLVGTAATFWLLLVSVPGIIGGVGLLRQRPWGRYMVLVLSVLDLLNIPIGTAIGVYSIWVLLQEETAKLFASGVSQ
ncbi:MAG: hypothetical protein GTO63_22220 [Anaerolineae bacterium]|nr:hypothetical protein [Anaerolineae bacterium]NIN97497.1 hypothetical protein [Anaerolineae bacterium]NIQ80426.1 hypothetical protein [Anaerolineae bacterium]